MDKRVLTFELSPRQVKIKEALDKDFLPVTIRAISDIDPNRNESHFALDGMKKAVENGNFYNRPILANFVPEKDDFGGHDGVVKYDPELDELYEDFTNPNCETPIGSIRESDRVEIIYDEKQKVHWIEFDAIIWTRYSYKQVKKILKSRNGKTKISVEIEVLDSEIREDGVEEIKEFNYLGTTLLGDDLITGIQNAELTTPISNILATLESVFFQNKKKALEFAYNAYDKTKEQYLGSFEKDADEDINNTGNILKNSSNEDNDDANDINENPSEEISMENQESQKGGKVEMILTMNMKRDLLEGWLRANYPFVKSKNGCDCYIWVYVTDLTDTEVFFEVEDNEGDFYYKAPYTISEIDDEVQENKYEANIDLTQKVRVTRSWVEYTAKDDNNDDAEDDKNDDDSDNGNNDNDKTTESVNDTQGECKFEDNADDNADDKKDDKEDNKEEECKFEGDKEDECKFKDNKEEECNKFESINLNSEPTPAETTNKAVESIVADAMNSIAAPAIQVENQTDDAVVTETTPDAPNGQQVTTASEPEGQATLLQPNDSNKEVNFTADSENTVEINGVNYTFAQLQEAYSNLQAKVDEFENEKINKQVEALITFGSEFINNDENVDDESKANFVKQVKEKCEAFELKDNDAVTTFARGLLAMYYYENASQIKEKAMNNINNTDNANNEQVDTFSAPIEKEQVTNTRTSIDEMRESTNALRNLIDSDYGD